MTSNHFINELILTDRSFESSLRACDPCLRVSTNGRKTNTSKANSNRRHLENGPKSHLDTICVNDKEVGITVLEFCRIKGQKKSCKVVPQ